MEFSQLFSKPTTSQFRELSIFDLKRLGFLKLGYRSNLVWSDAETLEETGRIGIANEGAVLHLNYRAREAGGEWVDINDKIILSKTNPHLGGERFWFICPGCQTRRAKLYGGVYFRCRSCRDAVYESQREPAHDRALRRLFKRRQKYGGHGGSCEPFPEKPKRMHWKTYSKLLDQDRKDAAKVEAFCQMFVERLRKLGDDIDRN